MQFLVVLAAAVACAAADVAHLGLSADYTAPIVRSTYDISPEGNSYQYSYETGNGISAQAEGILKNPNTENAFYEVKGGYRYTAPDGTPIETTYVAGPNGFQAEGSHIPVSPPIPEAILRSLAFIANNKPYVEPSKPFAEPAKPYYRT